MPRYCASAHTLMGQGTGVGLDELDRNLHGESSVLRQFIGKGVSIRGREYWVENSDMPVVVVGELIPLAPSTAAEEPVLF